MIRRRADGGAIVQFLVLATLSACAAPRQAPVVAGRPSAPSPPPAPAPAAPRTVSPSEGPNVFGSTAIRIRQTASDVKWRGIAGGVTQLPRSWAQALERASGAYGLERLMLVNTWVNRNVVQVTDRKLYGQSDLWADLERTAASGKGDCEDYAIAKMQMLRAAGVPASDLYLLIVNDLIRRQDHALLMVALDERFYVLDSNTDRLLRVEEVKDYRPVLTYSADRTWVHGYRHQPVDIRLAATISPGGR